MVKSAAINVDKYVDDVLKSRKNSNKITELYDALQKDESLQVRCLKGLEKVFCSFLKDNEFSVDANLRLTDEKAWEVEVRYVKWLEEVYEKTVKMFYKLLDSNKKAVKEQALASIMNVVRSEVKYPIQREGNKVVEPAFPSQRFQEIIDVVMSAKSNNSHLIACFEAYTKFQDIFFHTWKCLKKLVRRVQDSSDTFILNVLQLIERIPPQKSVPRKKDEAPKTEDKFFFESEEDRERARNRNLIQKAVTDVWRDLINRKASSVVHRRLLVVLLELFLPRLDDAVFFTDFLVASSNLGGANALLALQGILTLVQKYNMEYPNIYGKLYTMFKADIFHTKYRSRLFYLADVFLSSSHLPEKLVAAFAKRVARLILSAQVPDIVIGIRFIGNLLLRHPGLRKMVHGPEGEEVARDPFMAHEEEPTKTMAIDSSLWELSLLKNHVQPCVSVAAAAIIDRSLPTIEFDVSEVLDVKCEEVFESEAKRKMSASLSISRPTKIAKLADDRLYKLWHLT